MITQIPFYTEVYEKSGLSHLQTLLYGALELFGGKEWNTEEEIKDLTKLLGTNRKTIEAGLEKLKEAGLVNINNDTLTVVRRANIQSIEVNKTRVQHVLTDDQREGLDKLIEKWNELNKIYNALGVEVKLPGVRKATEDLEKEYKKAYEELGGRKEVGKGLQSFIGYVSKSTFWTHGFNLKSFLKQDNGLRKFYNMK